MATTYRFLLPEEELIVAPALRVTGAVAHRQFVLLYDLPDDPDLQLDDPSLSWSRSFNSFYRYAPASEVAGVLYTPPIRIPAGTRSFRVRVQARPSQSSGEVMDVALLSEMSDRPIIIFAEAS